MLSGSANQPLTTEADSPQYSPNQLMDLLELISIYLDPTVEQIVKLSDEANLTRLTKAIEPHLSHFFPDQEKIRSSTKGSIENILDSLTKDQQAIVWGHLLKFSFANTNFFLSPNPPKAFTFLKDNLKKSYKKASKKIVITPMIDNEGDKWEHSIHTVSLNKRTNPQKLFVDFMKQLVKEKPTFSNQLTAQCIHKYFSISKTIANAQKQTQLEDAFEYLALAGIGLTFFKALKLDGEGLQLKENAFEKFFFKEICIEFLKSEILDVSFETAFNLVKKSQMLKVSEEKTSTKHKKRHVSKRNSSTDSFFPPHFNKSQSITHTSPRVPVEESTILLSIEELDQGIANLSVLPNECSSNQRLKNRSNLRETRKIEPINEVGEEDYFSDRSEIYFSKKRRRKGSPTLKSSDLLLELSSVETCLQELPPPKRTTKKM